MEYLLLFSGFVILIVSGRYLVKGSVSLAFHFKLSKLIVGMTVVSLGTSAPELFVSVIASANGHPEIAIGNVIGSNIANIALILGITSIILPINVNRNIIKVDWPVMMFATILFFIFILNGVLSTLEGVFFILLLVLYIFYSVYQSRKSYIESDNEKPDFKNFTSIILIIGSSLGLALGSYLLVENASLIARNFGIDERIISITLIAIGTSVPELVTSITAAIRKEMDISVGNIIGSNIFNILGILGVASIIRKIDVPELTVRFDIYWVLLFAILLIVFILPARISKITRIEGIIFISVYFVYIYLLF